MHKYIIEVWREYKQIIVDIKYSIKRFIKYEIIAKLLTSIFLLPIFTLIIEFLMKSKGFLSLTNNQVLKFIFSFQGVISLILLMLLAGAVILMEIGGMIVISHQAYTKQPESKFHVILKFCLKKFKNLIGIGGALMMLYLCIIAPLVHIGLKTSLISFLKVPGFIQDVIDKNVWFSVAYYILSIVLMIMSIQWIFSLHIIIIENKSAREALKESTKLVKNNWKLLIKKITGIFFINVLLLLVIACIIVFSIFVLSYFIDFNTSVGNLVLSVIIALILYSIFFGSFIIIIFEIHYFTILYYTVAYKLQNKIPNLIVLEQKKEVKSFNSRLFKHKKIWMALIIGVFIMSVGVMCFVLKVIIDTKTDITITAHRGSSTEAPENTLAAINVAISHGDDFAEIDVQETKDGEVVLTHDKNLKRVTGIDKNIGQMSYEEINKLDAGSWFDKKFKGEKIPKLNEVIDFSKDKIKLNIEIKNSSYSKNLVGSVVKIIEEKGIVDECVVTSLDYDAILEVEKLNPNIQTGYIMFVALGDLSSLNVDFYSVEASNVNEEFIYNAHMQGRKVHAWTINKEEDMMQMIDLGVDNIITDKDEVLREILKDNGK